MALEETGNDAENSVSLYTNAESNLRDRVLGKVEKDSFTKLPSKRSHRRLMPSKCMSQGRCFIVIVQRGHDLIMDILLMGWLVVR